MENIINNIRDWFRQSTFLKILFIGFVMLILQIPISMISGQILDRQATKQSAIYDITEKWGRSQIIIGPQLVVPYYEQTGWINSNEREKIKRYATFLAESLTVDAIVHNEIRSRGIFDVPLYKTNITLAGQFKKPDFKKLGINSTLIIWDEAEIVFGVSDARAVQKQIFLTWNKDKIAFEPGMGKSNNTQNGFHVPLGNIEKNNINTFKTTLRLNGSQGLYNDVCFNLVI